MTHPLHRSLSSVKGLSQYSSQDIAETPDRATAKAANCPDQQPNSLLDIQTLQILDSSDDCIKVLDLQGRILFMNRGGQTLLGIQDITPFLNTFWVKFWQKGERQAAIDAIARAAAGEVSSLQGYCPTLNGEPKWWDNKISPILDADGNVERLLCISRDITDRKLAEDERQQTEAALRASEEEFRLFTAASSDTVYKMSADWRELRLLEGKNFLASSQHPNQTWLEQYIPVEEQTRVRAAIEEAIRTKSTFELEHRVIRLDGTIGWTFSRAIPLLNDQNEIVEWLGAASDVTVRKRAELSAEFLAIVTQNLVEATCVEDIIQIVGEQLHRYLHVSNCAFVEVNESADEATIHHSWYQENVPSLIGSYHLSELVTGEFFQTAKLGQTIIVRDVKTDPRIAAPQRFAALKIGSFINVPLIRDDEWKFTLGIYHQTPYNWRSDEIELMRELANRIWIKLERTRVELALRESEAKYRGLFESLDEGYFLADVIFDENDQPIDILYLETNPAATRMIGQDFTGRRLREIDPSYEAYWFEIFGRVARTGIGERLEQYDEPDRRWYDFYVFKVGNENSRCVSVVFKDITERKRREANAVFLAEIGEDFSRLSTADEIMQTVGAKIGAYLRVTTCNFTDVDEAHDRVIVHQGWSSPEVPSTVGTFCISQYLSKEFERASRAGETVVVCNTQTDPRTDAAGYAALNMHSFVTVPFHRNGRWTHYIAICDSQPRDWHESEIQLSEEIAARIFPRLERARAEAALRASEAKYRSLFESMNDGFCIIELIYNEQQQPIDYRFLETNPAFEWQSGLSDPIGKTGLYFAPNHEPELLANYQQALVTGESIEFEIRMADLGRHYRISVNRHGDLQEKQLAIVFNDITERKQAEAAIAADLRDTQLLRDLSARLATEESIQALYQEITAAAIALTHADAGTVQILDETTQDLLLLATQGFEQKMVEHFYRVNASSNTSCGIALKSSIRSFVDFDVPASVDPDGSMRLHVEAGLLSAQSTPLISRSGKPIGMVSTHWRTRHRPSDRELRFLDLLARQAADLIDRRQTEAALRESEELKQSILDSSKDCIKVLTLDGEIIYMNTGGLRLLESDDPMLILNARWLDFWQGEDRENAETAIAAAKAGNTGQLQGYRPTHKGTPKWWDILITPVRNSAGQVTQLLAVSRDITKQKQAETERERLLAQEQAAREQAETANRIKDEFLAVLSHELRSPLNPILGWTRLLQNGKLDAVRQREALATIERNAKLQTQLIEDLLDISRIMRGKLSLTVAPVSLPYVISAAVETVRLAAEAKTIQIILDLAPGVAFVSGDAARLQQVVWNLLSNAVKFTPDGGQVIVELRQLDRLAQIRVIDTGKGITPQFLPYVFEYFRQEDGSTTRKFGGLGLGLAIVRQIVQMHGGSVWAESQGEGQGATFIVQLPMTQHTAVLSETRQPQSDPGLPLAGIQILLVDDEPDTREFQAFLLEHNGAKVTAVASGLEALQALEQSIPDVIVSDIGMPEIDGYMLLQQIHSRLSERGGSIPAVALTAYAAEIDRQRAIQVGFQRHITKPVEPEALVKAVSTLLERT